MLSGISKKILYLHIALLFFCTDQPTEPKTLDITEVVSKISESCYLIGIEQDKGILGLGSGFAISNNEIMTNAHVVLGLIDFLEYYGQDDYSIIAVKDGSILGGDGTFHIDSFRIHPSYDSTTNFTYDFGLLKTKRIINNILSPASADILSSLMVGQNIYTIGFPGETNDVNTNLPISTFKNGTISALRPLDNEGSSDRSVIQHNCNTTGGTSGSPIFNATGDVIAVHNSGAYEFIQNLDGSWDRIPVGSINYSICIDKSINIFNEDFTSFKSITPEIVTYTFINETWGDLKLYINDVLWDTITWKDTLELWSYKGEPVEMALKFESICATNNTLTWRDTMEMGVNFSRRYIVPNTWFFLGIKNSTNKNMNSVVVSNYQVYDSSYVYLPIGYYKDIGYYQVSTMTDFRLYFYNATQYVYWEDQNTTSSTDEATYYYLDASTTIRNNSNNIEMKINRKYRNRIGKKRRYKRSDYLNQQK